jgi:cell division protein FtsW
MFNFSDKVHELFVTYFDNSKNLLNKNLIAVILVLMAFGWIVSSSASIGHYNNLDKSISQAKYIIFALFIAAVIVSVKSTIYKKIAPWVYILTLILLILILVTPIGVEVNGSKRWLKIWVQFQPSEIMKLSIIFITANALIKSQTTLPRLSLHPFSKKIGFWRFVKLFEVLVWLILPIGLIMAETDLGASILIALISLAMLFSAGFYLKQIGIIALISLLLGVVYALSELVRLKRIAGFLQDEIWLNTSAAAVQTQQALIGIARGDWFGVGLGNGIQTYKKLNESHTDMIFSVVGEELGIIGMLFVVLMFAYIVFKCFMIAKQALLINNKHNAYIAFGICAWLSLQFGVNVLVNLGLIPPKGFALPLISYGGTTTLMIITALAVILRIDIDNKIQQKLC